MSTISNGLSPLTSTIIKPDSLKIDISVLNKNVSVQLSILCLTKKKVTLSESKLNAIISDCEVVDQVNNFMKPTREPFWKSVFLGSFWIQIVKIIIYSMIGLLILFAISHLFEFLEERKSQKALYAAEQISTQLSFDKGVSVKHPNYFANAYELLNGLNSSEISVLYKIIKAYDKSADFTREAVANRALTSSEKEIFNNLLLGKKSSAVKSIIDHQSIYYTENLLEYFIDKRIKKS